MLTNYRLQAPSVVILADDRDPYVSWENHLERTSGLRGGVDIVAPVGTPVYARTAGTMIHVPNYGSAGNSCLFHHDANPGWKDVFSHLSRYVGKSGDHFEAGEIVAYTGTTGGVAPHLHWHLLDPSGVRQNPWDHFTPSGLALLDQKQLDELEDIMADPQVLALLKKTTQRPIIMHDGETDLYWLVSYDRGEKFRIRNGVQLEAIREGFGYEEYIGQPPAMFEGLVEVGA